MSRSEGNEVRLGMYGTLTPKCWVWYQAAHIVAMVVPGRSAIVPGGNHSTVNHGNGAHVTSGARRTPGGKPGHSHVELIARDHCAKGYSRLSFATSPSKTWKEPMFMVRMPGVTASHVPICSSPVSCSSSMSH